MVRNYKLGPLLFSLQIILLTNFHYMNKKLPIEQFIILKFPQPYIICHEEANLTDTYSIPILPENSPTVAHRTNATIATAQTVVFSFVIVMSRCFEHLGQWYIL